MSACPLTLQLTKMPSEGAELLVARSFSWCASAIGNKWALGLCRAALCNGHAAIMTGGLRHNDFEGPRQLLDGLNGGWLAVRKLLPTAAHAFQLLRFALLGWSHCPAMYSALAPGLAVAIRMAAETQSPLAEGFRKLAALALHQHHQPGGRDSVSDALAAVVGHPSPAPELAVQSALASWLHARVATGLVPAAAVRLRQKNELVGLRNLGNTCFMNSFLQALHATQPFRAAMIAADFRVEATSPTGLTPAAAAKLPLQRAFLQGLQGLHGQLMLSAATAVSPDSLLAALPAWDCVTEWRRSHRQQDAAEFGQLLLDAVDWALKTVTGSNRHFLPAPGKLWFDSWLNKICIPETQRA